MKYLSIQTFQCGISVSGLATFTGGAEINILSLNGATTSSEASLFLGAHSSLEGGQLVLQKGTGQTYAAHLDNYSDQFRVLFGTNTGSAGVAMSINLATRQLTLPTYTSTSSFPGTVAGYLAFDSVGNIITTSLALSGYVPTSRTLTINGTSYDLSADRTWTINTVDYTSRLQHQVKAGVAINKGQAVYVTSADGTNMIVGLASNASEATSSKTMGLLDATVAINGFANVVTEGLLAGLDTSTAGTEGDPVWLGTGGNLIYGLANKPSAPAHLVFIGIVTRKNNSNGEIFVKVQNGFELNEIHDVDIKTTVPVNGHILGFDGTLWVNKTIAGWLGYTPVSGTGTTNYLPKFTGSTSLGDSKFFDNGTTSSIYVNSLNATSRFYFTPVHADGRINFGAVAGSADNVLIRAWHDGNKTGFGTGSSAGGGALTTYGDSVLIGPSGAIYFMNGTFGPNNIPYRLGIGTSATATYFSSGVSNNLTNIESNEFIFTAKAHTFYTGTTTGNQSNPNQYTPLFLSTAGNVGIGTTGLVPGYLLTINGGVSITAGQSLSLDPSAGIYMVASSSQFRLYNNSIAALSVASTGNVLINTTTDSGYKLDVNGTARIKGNVDITTSGGTNVLLAYSSYVQAWQSFYVSQGGGTHNFAVSNASSGGNAYFNNVNVGIGTTSPSEKLHVSGNSVGITIDGTIASRTYYNRAGAYIWSTGLRAGDTKFHIYDERSADRFVIDDFGNIGIGTISPTSILDASVSSGATSGFRFKGWSDASTPYLLSLGTQTYQDIFQIKSVNGLVTMGIVGAVGSTPDLAFQTNSTERMRITSGGNVGIGTTSPGAELAINSGNSNTRIFVQNAGSTKLEIGYGPTGYGFTHPTGEFIAHSDNLYFGQISSVGTNVTLTTGGAVGIGTTSPSKKLEVADSDIKVNGVTIGKGPGTISGNINHNIAFGVNNFSSYSIADRAHIGIGYNAFQNITGGYYSIAIGGYAMDAVINPDESIAIGLDALGSATYPSRSVAIGNGALLSDTEGYGNVALGARAGNYLNSAFGGYGENTLIGNSAGNSLKNARETTVLGAGALWSTTSNTSLSRANTAIGASSAWAWLSGRDNVWLGYNTNGFINGSYNVIIGANVSSTAIDGAGTLNNSIVLADGQGNIRIFSNSVGNVGIGTTTPYEKLEVNGAISATGAVNGTSAQGHSTTLAVQSGTSFLYAVDWGAEFKPISVQAKTISLETGTGSTTSRLFIDNSGNVGIGTTSPSQLLHVAGNIRVTGAFYDSNNQAGSAGQILKSTGTGTDWVSLSEITGVDGSGTANYVTKWSDADTVTNSLIYDNGTNVGIGTTSPGYNFDVNGQVRVQDKLRVGTVNSGNGVVHMSSSATINPNTTTIVWAQNVSVGMCAFIEYYILNDTSLTDQRAGTIMVTWNQSGTPTIAHTETTTPDIGSTTSINFTSSLVGSDARINAVNSSANPYTIVMSYKYF